VTSCSLFTANRKDNAIEINFYKNNETQVKSELLVNYICRSSFFWAEQKFNMNLTSVVFAERPNQTKISNCAMLNHELGLGFVFVFGWGWLMDWWTDGWWWQRTTKTAAMDQVDEGQRAGNCHLNDRQPAGDRWPQVKLGIPSIQCRISPWKPPKPLKNPQNPIGCKLFGCPIAVHVVQWIKWGENQEKRASFSAFFHFPLKLLVDKIIFVISVGKNKWTWVHKQANMFKAAYYYTDLLIVI